MKLETNMTKDEIKKLKELQTLELNILKEVDRVCKKFNITYYLGEGTLLGAIRHNGFIPWDDDIDILMERDQYDRFLKLAPEELSNNLRLQCRATVENYWSSFAKVRSLDTSVFNQKYLKRLTDETGPYIDIFPLDNLKKEKSFKYYFEHSMLKVYRFALSLKLKVAKPKQFKHHIIKYTFRFLPVNTLHNRMEKISTKYNNPNNKYLVNLSSWYPSSKETFPKDWFGEPRYIKFEDCVLPVPAEAEKVLTKIYGNFMDYPPIEKRVFKHSFEE